MTKDDIDKMWGQALNESIKNNEEFTRYRFANLVAAHEREACAKVCEDEAWRLKKLAVDTNSSSTNTKAIQASNDSDSIRARGTT